MTGISTEFEYPVYDSKRAQGDVTLQSSEEFLAWIHESLAAWNQCDDQVSKAKTKDEITSATAERQLYVDAIVSLCMTFVEKQRPKWNYAKLEESFRLKKIPIYLFAHYEKPEPKYHFSLFVLITNTTDRGLACSREIAVSTWKSISRQLLLDNAPETHIAALNRQFLILVGFS